MYILGISAFYHDSAACLLKDGEIVAAAAEERFSRIKHDAEFPGAAIAYCLAEADISIDQVTHIVFYEKPFLKFERLLETYLRHAPRGLISFMTAMPVWIERKLWLEDIVRKELSWGGSLLFTEHHESHAASAFYPSPFEDAAILTLDAVGEWATASWGTGKGNLIRLEEEMRFPDSIGLLYSAFTYYCGFKVNSGEYKLMGLAPYGKPRFRDTILEKVISVQPDGSFKLNSGYFNYEVGLTMTNPQMEALFGASARAPEGELTQHYMDVAASIQAVTEELVLSMARYVHEKTRARFLCMAGGVALNCVANSRLLRDGPFEDIWVQPASGDDGGAVGAALWVWHQHVGHPRTVRKDDAMHGAYLGPSFSDDAIRVSLREAGVVYEELGTDALISRVAGLLASDKVIGWFQGRMEFGPRALGNRSILGDPRSSSMQTTMNLKIKFRESFRPFAPAVLAEHRSEWFDRRYSSPYMLFTAPVSSSKRVVAKQSNVHGLALLSVERSIIPAVTHVDYSARLQTVHKETNPLFHALVSAFRDITGCPVVINTSFNVRGEPIVCTPADAIKCFLRTNMDYLAIGPFLLDRATQPEGLAVSSAPDANVLD